MPKRGEWRSGKKEYEIRWSKDEERTLRRLWPDSDAIAERLGRSRKAVRGKGRELDLPRRPPSQPWSEEHSEFVLNSDLPLKEQSAVVGRSVNSIQWKRSKARAQGRLVPPAPNYGRWGKPICPEPSPGSSSGSER